MALPNWGNFMVKVYADHQLPYGKMTQFQVPADMQNSQLTDANMAIWAKQGDTTNVTPDQDSTDNAPKNDF